MWNFISKILIAIAILNTIGHVRSFSWDFDCSSVNERHTHEEFCFRYYECTEDDVGNWIIQLKSCPHGRIFNEVEGRCEDGECPTEPPPCLRFPFYYRLSEGTKGWDFQCHVLNERYQHDTHCNRYYECNEDDVGNWIIEVHSCPPGRVFDTEGSRCVDGSCPTSVPPDCGTSTFATEIPDPSTVQPEPSPSTVKPEPEPSTLRPDPSVVTIDPDPPTTTSTAFKCTEEGVFPDPWDCKLSHTCVWTEDGFVDIPFRCPGEQNYCQDSKACGDCPCETGPSTIKPDPSGPTVDPDPPTTTSTAFKCTEEGVFPDPWDCKLSHTCIRTEDGLVDVPFRCPGEQNYCQDSKTCGNCPCSTLQA